MGPASTAQLQGLPLAAASGFLAKDARMLLRKTAANQVCMHEWLWGVWAHASLCCRWLIFVGCRTEICKHSPQVVGCNGNS